MNPRQWTLLCDFDGTVAHGDVTDALLARFARKEWADLEAHWRAGLIGSRECMQGQIELLDCTREELDAHLAAHSIDEAFQEFVDHACALGFALEIVSDGIDHACAALLRRAALGGVPLFANVLEATGERTWSLRFPFSAPRCGAGMCKCARARAHEAAGRPYTLLIGDGVSDFCLAQRATLVFARGTLLRYCREGGIAHRRVENFRQALDELLPMVGRHSDRARFPGEAQGPRA